jgi:hypothetical protein
MRCHDLAERSELYESLRRFILRALPSASMQLLLLYTLLHDGQSPRGIVWDLLKSAMQCSASFLLLHHPQHDQQQVDSILYPPSLSLPWGKLVANHNQLAFIPAAQLISSLPSVIQLQQHPVPGYRVHGESVPGQIYAHYHNSSVMVLNSYVMSKILCVGLQEMIGYTYTQVRLLSSQSTLAWMVTVPLYVR